MSDEDGPSLLPSLDINDEGPTWDDLKQAKKRKSSYFKWTYEAEHLLAKEVNKKKAHLKSQKKKGAATLTAEEKWKAVLKSLKENSSNAFDDFVVNEQGTSWKTLQGHFSDMLKDVKKENGSGQSICKFVSTQETTD